MTLCFEFNCDKTTWTKEAKKYANAFFVSFLAKNRPQIFPK